MIEKPSTGRILIVDDQETNLQILGSILVKLGYEIVPASSGEQALRRLNARPPDLVLLDIMMPGMDGFEVCQRIRQHPNCSQLPVIFLSSADDKEIIVRSFEVGGVDYVTKPFNAAELTSRVRTHLALKAARDSLSKLAEDKDELLGILTHDLKNHLGGMQMTAHLLHDRASKITDQPLTRMSENILHGTGQMLSFVNEFLANARADRGVTGHPEQLSLQETIGLAIRRHAGAAQRKGIVIHFELGDSAIIVKADRNALAQILDNLLSNALKFSPADRNVWLTLEPKENSRVEIHVKDEGPGLTPEDLQVMFVRYRRLSARPTAGEPSTGFGLSVVRQLVEDMQGEVRCESTPGNGATFIVSLPSVSS